MVGFLLGSLEIPPKKGLFNEYHFATPRTSKECNPKIGSPQINQNGLAKEKPTIGVTSLTHTGNPD